MCGLNFLGAFLCEAARTARARGSTLVCTLTSTVVGTTRVPTVYTGLTGERSSAGTDFNVLAEQ